MFIKDELYNAANSLLTCHNIIIITGFPCNLEHKPPTETDGPLGAVAIARSLVALGKKVTLLIDECNEEVLISCAAASGIRSDRLILESFPGRGEKTQGKDEKEQNLDKVENNEKVGVSDDNVSGGGGGTANDDSENNGENKGDSGDDGLGFDGSDMNRLAKIVSQCDAVIAIERAGPAMDGLCKTMGNKDMSPILAPLELLFNKDFIRDCRLEYGGLNIQEDTQEHEGWMQNTQEHGLDTQEHAGEEGSGSGLGVFMPMTGFDYDELAAKTLLEMEREGQLGQLTGATGTTGLTGSGLDGEMSGIGNTNNTNNTNINSINPYMPSTIPMPVLIGIGDGGNEVGMGKLYNEIIACESIKHAPEIACVTSCDHLIVAGVSNWGGYALSTAVAVLAAESILQPVSNTNTNVATSDSTTIPNTNTNNTNTSAMYPLSPQYITDHHTNVLNEVEDEPEMDTYEYRVLRVRRLEAEAVAAASNNTNNNITNTMNTLELYINTCVPCDIQERYICSAIVASGARDGILKCNDLYIDGFPLETSITILNTIRMCGLNNEQKLIDSIYNI